LQSNTTTEPTAVTHDTTYTIEHKASTTKHNTRFSTGILSCYIQIQALGSPQCRN